MQEVQDGPVDSAESQRVEDHSAELSKKDTIDLMWKLLEKTSKEDVVGVALVALHDSGCITTAFAGDVKNEILTTLGGIEMLKTRLVLGANMIQDE